MIEPLSFYKSTNNLKFYLIKMQGLRLNQYGILDSMEQVRITQIINIICI